MLERSSLVIRGKSESTKKRQQIDILLKRATKGDRRAKLKLYKEFGIRLYSAGEVERYVKTRMPQEYAPEARSPNNGPGGLTRKANPKAHHKNGVRQSPDPGSSARARLKKRKTAGRKT
jgi:hypothetical protein